MSKPTKTNPHRGSRFEDWRKEGIYEQVVAQAKKELSESGGTPEDDLEASIARRKKESASFESGYSEFKKRALKKK